MESWLLRYREAVKDLGVLEMKLSMLESRAVRITGGYDKVNVMGGGGDWDGVYADLADLRALYVRRTEECLRVMCEIEQAIEAGVDGMERRVLSLYYIGGYTLQNISELLCYSYSQIKRYKASGLEKLSRDEPSV